MPGRSGRLRRGSLAAALLMPPVVALAAPASPPEPAAVAQALSNCRKIADDPGRLACYDKAAQSFDQAQAAGQIVVVDRAQVTAVRRQAFGFNIPSITFFPHEPKAEAVDRLTVELASAHQDGEGRWVMVTTDDAVWRQTDAATLYSDPHPGSKLAIRKGVLGSFFCKIDAEAAVRCARDR